MREKLKDMVRCSLTAILALLLVVSAFSPEALAEARAEYIESSEKTIGQMMRTGTLHLIIKRILTEIGRVNLAYLY